MGKLAAHVAAIALTLVIAGTDRSDETVSIVRGAHALFVADAESGLVRAFDVASATVSTLVAGLSRPRAVAYDAATATLYIRERHGLVAIDVERRIVTALE